MEFLWGENGQLIYHTSLSIYVLVYYSLYLYMVISEKNHASKSNDTHKSLSKSIGYFYLIVESIFLVDYIKTFSMNYLMILLHLCSVLVILTAFVINRKEKNRNLLK